MGNEMGNNNTSGLREDNTAQDMSQIEVAHADDLKGQNHVVPVTHDKDSQGKETGLVSGDVGREDPNIDDQKIDNKDDNIKNEDAKSLQDAAQKDDDKEQNHEVLASENKYEEGTGLASTNLEGVTELHNDNQIQDEKVMVTAAEEDYNMIPETMEKSLQEAAFAADEAQGQDHLVPAAEGENTHGNDTELVSCKADGKGGWTDAEKDNSTKAEEIPLQEAASTVETKTDAHLVPADEDKNNHGIETGLVSSDHDGMANPRVDNQKQDVKEEDTTIDPEAKEKSSQEAVSTDVVERQDHLVPAVEAENTPGNETGSVPSDPEVTDPGDDNTKQAEKEEGNTDGEPLPKDDQADDFEEKILTIPLAEGKDCDNTEAEAVAELDSGGDPVEVGDTLINQTIEEKEQGRNELHPPTESTKVEEKPNEASDEGRDTQPASPSKSLEDHEMQIESNFEESLSGISHDHFENQSSLMKEEEGMVNSVSDAVSSASHDPVPQEPAVLEPKEHELGKIHTEELVQVCNGPLKREDMIIPTLTCQDQENGFILNSSISTDMVKVPDPSLEVEKERGDFLVKKKLESKDGDEVGNHLGNITTMMTDLPNGVGAKCNEEIPSEMNSMKNDSPDETQNLSLEVSTAEEKDIVLSQEATLVSEEPENGNTMHFDIPIQPGEELIGISNGHGFEEGSSSDDPSRDSKNCKLEEAKIIEKGHLVDVSISYQNEATGVQQKDTQNEGLLVTDPSVISADTEEKYEGEDSEEKKMIEETLEKGEDSNPVGNDPLRRENGGQCISSSHPIEQAEAFLSPSPCHHALTEKLQLDSHLECKKVQNSNECMAEAKLESSGEFSTTGASSFTPQTSTEKTVVSGVDLAVQKPTAVTVAETNPSLKQSSEQCEIGETPTDYYQRDSEGRFSTESNPDSTSIHAQMRKSPSFDLDLRLDARAEESDQTPLLYQDKTTIESIPSQADVTEPEKPASDTEYAKNSLHYEPMAVEEKVVTLERSDSEKSKTPFLGFLKEEEEADQMLIPPKKQDNQSAAKKATKVSAKVVASAASTKGKEKRKPRTSLFGTCMCCATVIN
ncbi:hypothetical protein PTKIN_Ptkin09bG0055400 [Pterospermum kingtungense]